MSELRGQASIVVGVLLAAVGFLVLAPRAETQQACAFSVRIDGTPVTIPVQSDGEIVVEVGADGYSTRTEHRCTPQAPLPVSTATPAPATAMPVCSTSLQSLIDQAPSGSTLTLGACIYREAVTVGKPLTLNGQGLAEIRGSHVWTQWDQGVQRWTSVRTIPPFDPESSSAHFNDEFQARHPEQVFIDGTEQRQVAGNPAAGQFTIDGSRHVILGTNPSGKMVEVTVRKAWLLPQADDVTVRGLVMSTSAPTVRAGPSATMAAPDFPKWLRRLGLGLAVGRNQAYRQRQHRDRGQPRLRQRRAWYLVRHRLR